MFFFPQSFLFPHFSSLSLFLKYPFQHCLSHQMAKLQIQCCVWPLHNQQWDLANKYIHHCLALRTSACIQQILRVRLSWSWMWTLNQLITKFISLVKDFVLNSQCMENTLENLTLKISRVLRPQTAAHWKWCHKISKYGLESSHLQRPDGDGYN